jgi:hypothetical protein
MTSTHRPFWHAAVLFMHGLAKQATFGPVQRTSGSPLAKTRQTHGASWQYDDQVRQSVSALHAPGAGAPGVDAPGVDASEVGAADAVATGIVATEASMSARSCAASFAGLLVLQAMPANTSTAMTTVKFRGAEGDRTPDLIHAMDALSQLSYGPEKVQGVYSGSARLSSALTSLMSSSSLISLMP